MFEKVEPQRTPESTSGKLKKLLKVMTVVGSVLGSTMGIASAEQKQFPISASELSGTEIIVGDITLSDILEGKISKETARKLRTAWEDEKEEAQSAAGLSDEEFNPAFNADARVQTVEQMLSEVDRAAELQENLDFTRLQLRATTLTLRLQTLMLDDENSADPYAEGQVVSEVEAEPLVVTMTADELQAEINAVMEKIASIQPSN